ncbi:MAG: 2-amino-4-hydroxy-6-hydroxymethyldihydropteridine diphosphokinase [Chloroflexota bacterium]
MDCEQVEVYLSLGSNIGDRKANLDRALRLLSERLRILQISSIYDTEPVGEIEQPRFLNLVCKAQTGLTPQGLLSFAKGIEFKLGRKLGTSGLPRTIDIDILLYGDRVIKTPELVIPHPRMTERAFVLIPLVEIAPDLLYPGSNKTINQLLEEVSGKSGVRRWIGDSEEQCMKSR